VVAARQAFEFQQERYRRTLELARTGNIQALEAMAGVGREYLEALASFSPALLAAQFPNENNLFADERFAERHREHMQEMHGGFRAVAAVGSATAQSTDQAVSKLEEIKRGQRELITTMENVGLALMLGKRIANAPHPVTWYGDVGGG
jgi:hypothetical protein